MLAYHEDESFVVVFILGFVDVVGNGIGQSETDIDPIKAYMINSLNSLRQMPSSLSLPLSLFFPGPTTLLFNCIPQQRLQIVKHNSRKFQRQLKMMLLLIDILTPPPRNNNIAPSTTNSQSHIRIDRPLLDQGLVVDYRVYIVDEPWMMHRE